MKDFENLNTFRNRNSDFLIIKTRKAKSDNAKLFYITIDNCDPVF